jgi:NAD(P)-dependent dehydrogenase (short-subunit alcohol dehydrogenase family)
MMLLAGKSAVITGSTSAIGLGIARALAGADADIVLNGFGEAGSIRDSRTDWGGGGLPLLGSGCSDRGAALPVDGGSTAQ